MLVMALIGVVTIIASAMTFIKVQDEMIDTNINSLNIAQYQLDNYLDQIDYAFYTYMRSEDSYRLMTSYKAATPPDDRLIATARTHKWMEENMGSRSVIDGTFCYFPRINLYLSRSNMAMSVAEHFKMYVSEGVILENRWAIHEIDGQKYLAKIYRGEHFYGGAWISVEHLYQLLGLSERNYDGIPYLEDQLGTCSRDNLSQQAAGARILHSTKENSKKVKIYVAIPRMNLFKRLPVFIYILFSLTIASIVSIPFLGMWLRRKIANPLRTIDDAMVEIANGNVDYRIRVPGGDSVDEFGRLSLRINDTLDELNETTYKLYEETLRGQQTKLNYFSQQIRPHFILNALNIIYTYEEHEFPLVKQMVLYLTDYFRYIVNAKKDFVNLSQEMEHVQNYLKIQKERYLDRFDFFVEWEAEIEDSFIPPLIIQTFVENCVKYGMRSGDKSFVYVLAGKEDEKIKLMIADTGAGFSEETFEKFKRFLDTKQHQEGLGVGLENTVERIRILYDGHVDIRLRNALSGGAVVEIYLPIKWEDTFTNNFVQFI